MEGDKPIKVKPSFYAHCFYVLKEIALEYGYNLVLHGSMDRDLDLIAIPWMDEVKDSNLMIEAFADYLDGFIQFHREDEMFSILPQGRKSYVINLRRGGRTKFRNHCDFEYYLDISVTPSLKNS